MEFVIAGKPSNETRRVADGVMGRMRVACVVYVEGLGISMCGDDLCGASNVNERRVLVVCIHSGLIDDMHMLMGAAAVLFAIYTLCGSVYQDETAVRDCYVPVRMQEM